MELKEDSHLIIQLLRYDLPTPLTERFYFMEMSTLQATLLIQCDKQIVSAEIYAYTEDDEYIDDKLISTFKTIYDFNDFFIKNQQYYLHECDLKFEDGSRLFSHDDGEVSITFPLSNHERNVVEGIFTKYNLDRNLIKELKSKPGHYLAIDKNSNITGDFEDFEAYYKKCR